MSELLRIDRISKHYGKNVVVLDNLNLSLNRGESVAVVGPSGCGKSTLLNLIGLLDKPSKGKLFFKGEDLSLLSDKQTATFRNQNVGFIFQQHHLLPQCSVLDNVLVPTLINKRMKSKEQQERAMELLERVGLMHRLKHRPAALSGGECQRVAVVRALMNGPDLLLADEPTGSLSRDGSDRLVDLLLSLNALDNLTLLVVTHSLAVADRMSRTLVLEKGSLLPSA